MFYLYFILNTVSGTGYFGITNKSVRRRLLEHHYSASNNKKTKLYDAIRSYGIEAFAIYTVCESDTRDAIEWAEKEAIRLSGVKGLRLYNMTSGGDGGFVVPESKITEWKAKLSLARQGRKPALGMKHTEENKKLFSEVSRKYWEENRVYDPAIIAGFTSFKEANKQTGISKTHYYRIKRALASDQS